MIIVDKFLEFVFNNRADASEHRQKKEECERKLNRLKRKKSIMEGAETIIDRQVVDQLKALEDHFVEPRRKKHG